MGFALNRCCVCLEQLGPDDFDGICPNCDEEPEEGESQMLSSDYDDNRPMDGQDEREQRRVLQEFCDIEAIDRYNALITRLFISRLIPDQTYWTVVDANEVLVREIPALLAKEGY